MRVRKPAEDRKAEIVTAALRLADKLGPDRLSTQTIAEAVGLTQTGVFRHFPRKQDIWEAVAVRIGEKMQQRWAQAQQSATDPAAQLRAMVVEQLRLLRATPAIPAILFSRELHVENETLRKSFSGLMRQCHDLLASIVTQGCQQGHFRADLDPDDAALLLVGLVQSLALRWSLSGRTFNLVKEGERLVDVQLDGFASTPRLTQRGMVSKRASSTARK